MRFQKFVFSKDTPGKVFLSGSQDLADCTVNILQPGCKLEDLTPANLPEPLQPAGISRQRLEYLHKNVRQYCHEESRDLTCPPPPPLEEEPAPVPASVEATQVGEAAMAAHGEV